MAERYLMPGGAIYGTNSHGWRNAFFRPPNRHEKIAGLYCVGGSTHPGGGTPTVLLSARIVSDLIRRYEGL
jgi:phytoene dehydrogenase-like protein